MHGFTGPEKVALVEGYLGVPHGLKGVWLAERGISRCVMQAWRRAYLFGDLERGLVPRDTAGMDPSDSRAVRRLEAQLAAERQARAREKAAHEAEVARLEAMNAALGKAIGLLHDLSAKQEPTDES